MRRWHLTIAWLPITIYMGEISLYISIIPLIFYGSIGLIVSLYQKKHLKWIICGYTFAILDVSLMWLGDNVYKEHYYWIHGTHHITCFSSIACMVKPILIHRKSIESDMVGLTCKDIELKHPMLPHRRSISVSNRLSYL